MLKVQFNKQKVIEKYDRQQFDLLMRCSEKHDTTDWNTWRKNNPHQPVILQDADLEKTYLRGADLHDADFRGANLRGVDLSGAKLFNFNRRWADLRGADFREADLCLTDFRGADLRDANFCRAYLFYTNLSWTNLSGADFTDADFWAFYYEAGLTGVDLSKARRMISEFSRVGCKYTRQKSAPWNSGVHPQTAAPENKYAITGKLQSSMQNTNQTPARIAI